jgi:hypothetical protein
LRDRELKVTPHVVEKNLDDFDVLIGRDFIDSNDLTLVYQKEAINDVGYMQIALPDVYFADAEFKSVTDDIKIDFGLSEKNQLI